MFNTKPSEDKMGLALREFQKILAEIDFKRPFTPDEEYRIKQFREWLWGKKDVG